MKGQPDSTARLLLLPCFCFAFFFLLLSAYCSFSGGGMGGNQSINQPTPADEVTFFFTRKGKKKLMPVFI
jgi:hypothetical protein